MVLRLVLRRMKPVAVPGLALALLAALPGLASAHHAKSGPPVEVAAGGKVTVVAREFTFIPAAIRVRQGRHVTIVFRNEGRLSHNLAIPGLGVYSETIQSGDEATVEFTAKTAGTYKFWCTVPGHKEAGMIGEVDVTDE